VDTYANLHIELRTTPWALDAGSMARLIAFADAGGLARVAAPGRNAAGHAGASPRAPKGRTVVIPIVGYIVPRPSVLTMLGMGTSSTEVSSALRAGLADPEVDRIVFDIDSAGGGVFGVDELATEIRAARATKPVIGIANSVASGSAYWLASACSELYVTPGGQVGGIGMVAAHEDMSKALEVQGIRVKLITAGMFKAEGNPYGPLGAEARAHMQAQVDGYGNDFARAVARGRNVPVETVRSAMGQGRTLRGNAALAANMVDGVMTFDSVLARPASGGARLTHGANAGLMVGAAMALRRLQFDRLCGD